MRTAIIYLLLALAAAAQAAPAPLPKRSDNTEEQELAYVQTEFDRMKGEFADRGVQLYRVGRGKSRHEWVVTYLPDSPHGEALWGGGDSVMCQVVRVVVLDYKQFNTALRDALARLKQ
jgi:hypothetical protein